MSTKKGMDIREGLKYSKEHEWVKAEADGTAVCGITDHAQDSLGDIVFVEFQVSDGSVKAGDTAAVVESAKAASDVYSPVSGEIIDVNKALEDSPETVNSAPYEDGWFFKIKLADKGELDSLMTADQYKEFLASCE